MPPSPAKVLDRWSRVASVPVFVDYQDALDWIARKSKEYGGRGPFTASPEYREAQPAIEALYKAQKRETDGKIRQDFATSGQAEGDRVEHTSVGMFLTVAHIEGTVEVRGGVPHVRIDPNPFTARKLVRWSPRWSRVGQPRAASAEGKLTTEHWAFIDDLIERASQRYKTPKVCHQVSEALARRFGWEVASGSYRGVGHYWNVMPDGTILDATRDQFDEDEAPVGMFPPGDPEQALYRRTTRTASGPVFEGPLDGSDLHPGTTMFQVSVPNPDYDPEDGVTVRGKFIPWGKPSLVVAYLLLGKDQRNPGVYVALQVWTDDKHRRQGFMRGMFDQAWEWVRSQGARLRTGWVQSPHADAYWRQLEREGKAEPYDEKNNLTGKGWFRTR